LKDINKLLLDNKAWAYEKNSVNPKYFIEMAKEQTPKYLWIGCADSRVPPNEVTGSSPGELFVARNVANLVIHTDMNLMSVVEYAVTYLKVRHIIICGHYGCGGVKAAMSPTSFGMINKWIRNIKDTYQLHHLELDKIENENDRFDRLVELNIYEQARNLTHTSIIQKAWHEKRDLFIHGWVYEMKTGHLKELITIDSKFDIEAIYRYKFD
jgi:carbonic anhydrase